MIRLIRFIRNAIHLLKLVHRSIKVGVAEMWHSLGVQTVQLLETQFPRSVAEGKTCVFLSEIYNVTQ